MSKIKDFIGSQTNRTLKADDKSMYRALRRFYEADMVTYISKASQNGPALKIYQLTNTGENVLQGFLKRNIIKIFYKPSIKRLIEA